MRIELNVKLEFDLNDSNLVVLAARISAREIGVKISEEEFLAYKDGTNEPANLPYPIAILSPVQSFLWRNQQIFERG